MKKILILSYFFPPSPQTASNRLKGIVDYFHKLGFYPVVVTRNWDLAIKQPQDTLKSSGDKIIHIKNDDHEIFYLPYKSSLRDKIFVKSDNIFVFKILSKILTLISTIFELISNKFIPYSNLFYFSKKLLQTDLNFKCVFISANPYMLFKFGYQLNKDTGIPWIADYRDAWTTNQMAKNERAIYKYLYKIQQLMEKKWVSTALFFTTVSDEYVKNIQNLIEKDGYAVFNGIKNINVESINICPANTKKLRILYSGSLYTNQDVESFLEAISMVNKIRDNVIEVYFVGVGYNSAQLNRIKESKYFDSNVILTSWLSNDELMKIVNESDILLMISYSGYNGIPTSKIFDYINYQKPIILFPSDNGILESLLGRVGNHHIINSKNELQNLLLKYIDNFEGQISQFKINNEAIEELSTYNQVKIISDQLNKRL